MIPYIILCAIIIVGYLVTLAVTAFCFNIASYDPDLAEHIETDSTGRVIGRVSRSELEAHRRDGLEWMVALGSTMAFIVVFLIGVGLFIA